MDNPNPIRSNLDKTKFPTEVLDNNTRYFVEELSKELNVKVDNVIATCLSALSFTLINKLYFQHKNWVLDVNLYQLVLAPPGSRKDAIMNRVFKPIYQYVKNERKFQNDKNMKAHNEINLLNKKITKLENTLAEEDKEKLEEIFQLQKKIKEREKAIIQDSFVLGGDITMEKLAEVLYESRERLTIATAEGNEFISQMLGRYTIEALELVLKAWEGSQFTVRRKNGTEISLDKPLLNLLLMTQPVNLHDIAKTQGRGLLQRFLIYYNLNSIKEEDLNIFYKVKIEAEEGFNYVINQLLKIEETIDCTVSIEAMEEFESFYREIELKRINEELTDVEKEWNSKIFSNLIKVVSIIRLIETHHGEGQVMSSIKITKEDVEKMRKLYEYYANTFKNSFNLMSKKVADDDLTFFFKRLINLFERNGMKSNLSLSYLNNNIKKFDARARNRLIEELEEHNLIYTIKFGRKSNISLHPKLQTQKKEDILKKYLQ